MKRAPDYLEEGAKIFRMRGEVYGDNYLNFGKLLIQLFPNGLTLKTAEDFDLFCAFLNVQMKLTRYASALMTGQNGHIDSAIDASVYAAMLTEITERVQVAMTEKERGK